MIKYEEIQIKHKKSVSVTCDVCKKEFFYDKDAMETEEFHYIRFRGGYGSVFADGISYKIDVCQHCLKKLLGEYMVEDEEITI